MRKPCDDVQPEFLILAGHDGGEIRQKYPHPGVAGLRKKREPKQPRFWLRDHLRRNGCPYLHTLLPSSPIRFPSIPKVRSIYATDQINRWIQNRKPVAAQGKIDNVQSATDFDCPAGSEIEFGSGSDKIMRASKLALMA